MYVCVCHAVSEEELNRLATQSQGCLKTVQSRCGAGSDCGSCLSRVMAIVNGKGRANHEPSRETSARPEKIPSRSV